MSGPESCQASFAKGNTGTGPHQLSTPDGATYTAFCQFNDDGSGLIFLSRTAVQEVTLNITRLYTTRYAPRGVHAWIGMKQVEVMVIMYRA